MVYGEPVSSTELDSWGTGSLSEYVGNMAKDGYIYASVDSRGTPFQVMAYPNRNHSISDKEASLHLATLFTAFLKQHCPPGGR